MYSVTRDSCLLPLYLVGDALALYMEMEEDNQKQIEAQLKEAFTDDAFAAYRKVTMIRWAGERVDVYANKIRQLVGLAGFKGDGLERLTKLSSQGSLKQSQSDFNRRQTSKP